MGLGKTMSNVEGEVETAKRPKDKHVRSGEEVNEELVLPDNRIVIVFIGLMLTVFLAALDQTIVCKSFWFLGDISYRPSHDS